MLGSLGPSELLIIFLIILVLFGARKLPQLGKGLGEGIRNFKGGLSGDSADEPTGEIPPSSDDTRG